MKFVRILTAALSLAAGLVPLSASAWWNPEFQHRTKVTLNTTAQGVETKEALSGVVVPLRLHSGNFDFLGAKPDGADLRVVAADDKTPLKFWVERFDGTNELAVVWVQVPVMSPGTDKNAVFVYAGNEKATAEAATPAIFDGAMAAAISFSGQAGEPAADSTGKIVSATPVVRETNGLIGPSAKLEGQALTWSGDTLKAPAAGPYSLSLWLKPQNADGAVLKQGPLTLALRGGQLNAALGSTQAAGGTLPVNAWAHIAITVGAGKFTLYVNGAQAAQADLPASATQAIEGPLAIGEGLTGQLDQLEVASTVRSADWIRLAHAAQSAEAKLVLAVTQTEDSANGEAGGEEHGYMGILVANLTVDAWVVIIILGIMFAIAVWVMIDKALLVGRADKDNQKFLVQFREARDVITIGTQGHGHSPLARLYAAGLRELTKRDVGQPDARPLSGASIDAVKASIDADLVRESHTLNSKMVLLTIAISGGPFLGLLGTVVGVMITFAAIAAAGDVNVNAIAPGIAAALLATVAGLGVAIPALFGYNYLAARIKNISSDMQIFVDEFVTRVAESYGAR
jgi:biopolymer transport protein ExbB